MRLFIANAALFQAQWFICAQGNNQWALLSGIAHLLLHYRLFKPQALEWLSIIFFTLLGLIIETIIGSIGIIEFKNSYVVGDIYIAPLWLILMWAAFATTLHHSLNWLSTHYLQAAFLCLLFVPSSYYVGAQLSQSQFTASFYYALLAEGIIWAIIFPSCFFLLRKGRSKC